MAKKQAIHENLSRQDEVKIGSNRSFGFVFTVVFAVVGALPLLDGEFVRWWAFVVAGLFLAVSLFVPRLLKPLNKLWFRFGLLLHKIVTPVIMGLLFFTTITPIALFIRLTGKDPLRLRFDPDAKSYWIERDPPGPEPETMRYQF